LLFLGRIRNQCRQQNVVVGSCKTEFLFKFKRQIIKQCKHKNHVLPTKPVVFDHGLSWPLSTTPASGNFPFADRKPADIVPKPVVPVDAKLAEPVHFGTAESKPVGLLLNVAEPLSKRIVEPDAAPVRLRFGLKPVRPVELRVEQSPPFT
jgi:hypothetical protein